MSEYNGAEVCDDVQALVGGGVFCLFTRLSIDIFVILFVRSERSRLWETADREKRGGCKGGGRRALRVTEIRVQEHAERAYQSAMAHSNAVWTAI